MYNVWDRVSIWVKNDDSWIVEHRELNIWQVTIFDILNLIVVNTIRSLEVVCVGGTLVLRSILCWVVVFFSGFYCIILFLYLST